ncbi:hypothetical protein BOVATA_021550 [Babesia ovata]|uniref:Uncharacterized protein n=1 Tax=Babesia ovata TaxID=189622 RepID=A0A2H6KCE7_9APIC|nr:uncharacterized protein BOVATA_021550 [Babesia ovata]GBE60662.1 hypothetical protein BOVATA_021550 [Babesia ovata]
MASQVDQRTMKTSTGAPAVCVYTAGEIRSEGKTPQASADENKKKIEDLERSIKFCRYICASLFAYSIILDIFLCKELAAPPGSSSFGKGTSVHLRRSVGDHPGHKRGSAVLAKTVSHLLAQESRCSRRRQNPGLY